MEYFPFTLQLLLLLQRTGTNFMGKYYNYSFRLNLLVLDSCQSNLFIFLAGTLCTHNNNSLSFSPDIYILFPSGKPIAYLFEHIFLNFKYTKIFLICEYFQIPFQYFLRLPHFF